MSAWLHDSWVSQLQLELQWEYSFTLDLGLTHLLQQPVIWAVVD